MNKKIENLVKELHWKNITRKELKYKENKQMKICKEKHEITNIQR
jgi:hypothetical protein